MGMHERQNGGSGVLRLTSITGAFARGSWPAALDTELLCGGAPLMYASFSAAILTCAAPSGVVSCMLVGETHTFRFAIRVYILQGSGVT